MCLLVSKVVNRSFRSPAGHNHASRWGVRFVWPLRLKLLTPLPKSEFGWRIILSSLRRFIMKWINQTAARKRQGFRSPKKAFNNQQTINSVQNCVYTPQICPVFSREERNLTYVDRNTFRCCNLSMYEMIFALLCNGLQCSNERIYVKAHVKLLQPFVSHHSSNFHVLVIVNSGTENSGC